MQNAADDRHGCPRVDWTALLSGLKTPVRDAARWPKGACQAEALCKGEKTMDEAVTEAKTELATYPGGKAGGDLPQNGRNKPERSGRMPYSAIEALGRGSISGGIYGSELSE